MLYFKKLWIVPEALLLMFWALCKYVGPYFINSVTKVLWEISNKLSLDFTNSIVKLEDLNESLKVWESKVLYIVALIALLVIVWFVVDLLNGQLVRDVKLAPTIRFLVRDIAQDSLNVVMSEERDANKWIRRSRVIKWEKKLMFIMPVMANSTVTKIIKERCDSDLLSCLSESFNAVDWMPIKVKKGSIIKWIIVKQK